MDRFDDQAKNWDVNPDKQQRATTFAREISNFIKLQQQLDALEFGCGTGLLSFALKDHFKHITLVDTSKGMIDVLKDKISHEGIVNFSPLNTDLLSETQNIEPVNVIYTLMTMHHIHDLEKAFTKFHQLLKKDGYLCIADLVEEDGTFHKPELNFDGYLGFNRKKLENLLLKNGFKEVYYAIPHTISKENGREYPLFLMIAQKQS